MKIKLSLILILVCLGHSLALLSPISSLLSSLLLPKRRKTALSAPASGFENCSTEQAVIRNRAVFLQPNPPRAGEPLAVSWRGVVLQPIRPGSKLKVTVTTPGLLWGDLTVMDKEWDLCRTASKWGRKCPLPAGNLKLQEVVDVPSYVPPGKYNVMLKAFSPTSKQIGCVKFIVNL
ncbi:uncharacterized protein VTP21DRAFT_8694 [Calcarisporiella thermophila]|uniref:uncharacterized protein n=1 Tax=Calcarisporiella thermophila TaxID=911321 RepID=UPI0037432304